MKFCLIHPYHKDSDTFRLNELCDHAYFIHYAKVEQSRLPREESDFFFSLCGHGECRKR